MIESLEINQSQDLFNEFLEQQGEPTDKVESKVINDSTETEGVDNITPKVDLPEGKDLDLLTELPEGFESKEEDTEKEVVEDVQTDDTQVEYSFKALAGYLSEEGIIDFEDKDGLEDTPEVLFESVKNTIAKEIQNYKDSIPDKAKNLIEYLEKGGDVDTYLQAITKPFDIKNVDLTSETDQERVVRENLRLQEYTQEEIDETINDYKDSLILEKQSKVAVKQLQKYSDKREQSILQAQEIEQEQKREQYNTYINTLNTTIDTAESLAGLPVTVKEKNDFKRYLLAVDKEGLTQYAKECAEDPVKTQLELAYLKFMKYDFSKAVKKGESEATRKFKNIFKSNETNLKGGITKEESTSGLNDLSAFDQFRNKK